LIPTFSSNIINNDGKLSAKALSRLAFKSSHRISSLCSTQVASAAKNLHRRSRHAAAVAAGSSFLRRQKTPDAVKQASAWSAAAKPTTTTREWCRMARVLPTGFPCFYLLINLINFVSTNPKKSFSMRFLLTL
jgi:hypothetical protein